MFESNFCPYWQNIDVWIQFLSLLAEYRWLVSDESLALLDTEKAPTRTRVSGGGGGDGGGGDGEGGGVVMVVVVWWW